jgi:hypothetical protein
MKTIPFPINKGLIFQGLYFTNFNACCRYKGTATAQKPKWLKDHPNDFIRLSDIQGTAAASAVESVTDVGTVAAAPSPNPPAAAKDDNAPSAQTASEIARREIAIGGRTYVSLERLCSMVGRSQRALSRYCANGNGPPHVKIGGKIYFELDKIPEWAASRGLAFKSFA